MSADKQKNDSRDALIAAAKSVFASKGFDGATVKDLADVAKVNVSLISYYFGGKDGLYRACIETFGREGLASAERMLKAAASLSEFELRLGLFAEEFVVSQMKEKDVCTILQRDFGGGNPIAQELFREVFLKTFYRLRDFVASAQKTGLLRSDADAEITTGFLFGGLVHLLRAETVRHELGTESLENTDYRAKVIEHFVNGFTCGLAPRLSHDDKETLRRKNETRGAKKT